MGAACTVGGQEERFVGVSWFGTEIGCVGCFSAVGIQCCQLQAGGWVGVNVGPQVDGSCLEFLAEFSVDGECDSC